MVNGLQFFFFLLLIARWCNGILCRYQSLAHRGTLSEAVKRNDYYYGIVRHVFWLQARRGEKKYDRFHDERLRVFCEQHAILVPYDARPDQWQTNSRFCNEVWMVWEKRETMIYEFYFCTIRYRYASPISAKEIYRFDRSKWRLRVFDCLFTFSCKMKCSSGYSVIHLLVTMKRWRKGVRARAVHQGTRHTHTHTHILLDSMDYHTIRVRKKWQTGWIAPAKVYYIVYFFIMKKIIIIIID